MLLHKHRPDGCCNSHEEASCGETVDHYSMFCTSRLSPFSGWQCQVPGAEESVGRQGHGVYEFSNLCNALFSEVTDSFSFILNKFRELMAECSRFCLSSVSDHEVFFHASPIVNVDTFLLGVHPHCRGLSSEIASKEIAFFRVISQSHSVASWLKSGDGVLDVYGVFFFVTIEQWYSHCHFGCFILELLLLVERKISTSLGD